MKVLNEIQIRQKIRRLAIEILEHNHKVSDMILAGINENGMQFAQLLLNELLMITDKAITLTRISLKPSHPLQSDIILEMPLEQVKNKVIILIDDVANTGRTIFYATRPLMDTLPKKIEIAVLVDRTHKAFPVKVDYVGLSLATTLKEHIEVKIEDGEEWSVNLI